MSHTDLLDVVRDNGPLILTWAVVTLVGFGYAFYEPDKDVRQDAATSTASEVLHWAGMLCSIVAILGMAAVALTIAYVVIRYLVPFGIAVAFFQLVTGGLRAAGSMVMMPLRLLLSIGTAFMIPLGLLFAVVSMRDRK